MEKPKRLSDDDLDRYEKTVEALKKAGTPTAMEEENKDNQQTNNNQSKKKKKFTRVEQGIKKLSAEAQDAQKLLDEIEKNYDIELVKPIDLTTTIADPEKFTEENTEQTEEHLSKIRYEPTALYAYSKLKLLYIFFVHSQATDAATTKDFFEKQLAYSERHLTKANDTTLWESRFDWFWLVLKKVTWFFGDMEDYIRLHNRYWTIRIKPTLREKPSSPFKRKSYIPFFDKELPSALNDELEKIIKSSFGTSSKIFGSNPLLFKCFLDALNMANDNKPCLLLGETGTGKETISKLIHAASYRRHNKFRAVNCAGFSDTMFDSQFSGVVEGAATGVHAQLGNVLAASGYKIEEVGQGKGRSKIERITEPEQLKAKTETPKTKIGTLETKAMTMETNDGRLKTKTGNLESKVKTLEIKMENLKTKIDNLEKKTGTMETKAVTMETKAETLKRKAGTLFLDEVNSLTLAHQAKLLRIIQEKEVNVVGEYFSRKVELKFVCAANQDLLTKVANGEFRDDFYYRISAGIIQIPPLREMTDVIIEIAQEELFKLAQKKKPSITENEAPKISTNAYEKLTTHNWPGNIRELKNVMYKAHIQSRQENSHIVHSRHIELQKTTKLDTTMPDLNTLKYKDAKSKFDKQYIETALRKAGGNIALASRNTGHSRSHLTKKIKEFEIDVPSQKNL